MNWRRYRKPEGLESGERVGKRNARVESLGTYQGRCRDGRGLDSTNGCAVIAPLICYQHITSKAPRGASNADVARLVDAIVPPILAHIRAKHGLGAGAFIIPADVHDYLYDAGAINRDMFVDVTGGSALSEAHVGRLLEAFEAIPRDERAACAFFYKEHVTCVLRVDGEYHFVDTMPGDNGMGTRTCCADVNVLRTYLAHYVTKKLQAKDDRVCAGPYDELQAEFDPRTFQAFLWRNKP